MQLRQVPIAALTPAPYNPRKPLRPGSPTYRRLERSLQEFDLVQPIVWNEQTGHVVSGHQRLEILRNQGVEELPVVVVTLPLAREKALNVALNNAQLASDWDPDKLLEVIDELSQLPDVDVTLTGFDRSDVHDLLLRPTANQPPPYGPAAPPTDVTVTLRVPIASWSAFQPALDALLAAHPVPVHVEHAPGMPRSWG